MPNAFSDASCLDYITDLATQGYCSSLFQDGAAYQGGCANHCYCPLGGHYLRTGNTPGSGYSCNQLLSDNKGVAYGSKLAFFDLGDNQDNLYTPSNVQDIFSAAYSATARVHSNSWGSGGVYTYEAQDLKVDTFAYDNPEMLIVFAAGNDGAEGMPGTVGSPALAKNVLTVGASEEVT